MGAGEPVEYRPNWPRTFGQWQEAADFAEFLLKVADYQRLGLLMGGPVVDERECERILELASRRGVTPGALAGSGVKTGGSGDRAGV